MLFNNLTVFLDSHCISYEKYAEIAPYVSIRVGGVASLIVFPDTVEKFCDIISYVHGKIKYYVLGNGTNCYFSEYFDGIIISTKRLNKLKIYILTVITVENQTWDNFILTF